MDVWPSRDHVDCSPVPQVLVERGFTPRKRTIAPMFKLLLAIIASAVDCVTYARLLAREAQMEVKGCHGIRNVISYARVFFQTSDVECMKGGERRCKRGDFDVIIVDIVGSLVGSG